MNKRLKIDGFWLYVQAFLACLIAVGIVALYTDFGFSGIHIGYALTATLEELQTCYPTWFKEIYSAFLAMKIGVLSALFLVFFIYRPWLKLILRNAGLTEREFWENAGLFMASALLMLSISEIGLRFCGWYPGQVRYSKLFHQVDELKMMEGFTTDSAGIYKVDLNVSSKVRERYRNFKWLETLPFGVRFDMRRLGFLSETGVISLRNDWKDETNSGSNEFKENLLRIQRDGARNCFDSLIVHYQMHPFNEDGFYSIPFSARCPDRKNVLLLGDSFTWGHSSVDKTGSFSNTLLSRGYMVYNTGISGADVAQYKKVLETYLNQIQPDIVIVNFFMGNDVEYFQRKPNQDSPIMYATNAGMLYSFQYGVQISGADSTYKMVLKNLVIPEVNWINTIASKTVIGSFVWRFLVDNSIIDSHFPKVPTQPEVPYCKTELQEMKAYCQTKNVPFIISVIPKLGEEKLEGAVTVPSLFFDINYTEPEMTSEMYNTKDGHFNEKGHLVYANYLDSLIQNKLSKSDNVQ